MTKHRSKQTQLANGSATLAFQSRHGQASFEMRALCQNRTQLNDPVSDGFKKLRTGFRIGRAKRIECLRCEFAGLLDKVRGRAREDGMTEGLLVIRVNRQKLAAFAANRLIAY